MIGTNEPVEPRHSSLRQIIADIDKRAAEAELWRAQLPRENTRYLITLATIVAAAFLAGGTLVAVIVLLVKPH